MTKSDNGVRYVSYKAWRHTFFIKKFKITKKNKKNIEVPNKSSKLYEYKGSKNDQVKWISENQRWIRWVLQIKNENKV